MDSGQETNTTTASSTIVSPPVPTYDGVHHDRNQSLPNNSLQRENSYVSRPTKPLTRAATVSRPGLYRGPQNGSGGSLGVSAPSAPSTSIPMTSQYDNVQLYGPPALSIEIPDPSTVSTLPTVTQTGNGSTSNKPPVLLPSHAIISPPAMRPPPNVIRPENASLSYFDGTPEASSDPNAGPQTPKTKQESKAPSEYALHILFTQVSFKIYSDFILF